MPGCSRRPVTFASKRNCSRLLERLRWRSWSCFRATERPSCSSSARKTSPRPPPFPARPPPQLQVEVAQLGEDAGADLPREREEGVDPRRPGLLERPCDRDRPDLDGVFTVTRPLISPGHGRTPGGRPLANTRL